jgi:hypothetical protein
MVVDSLDLVDFLQQGRIRYQLLAEQSRCGNYRKGESLEQNVSDQHDVTSDIEGADLRRQSDRRSLSRAAATHNRKHIAGFQD